MPVVAEVLQQIVRPSLLIEVFDVHQIGRLVREPGLRHSVLTPAVYQDTAVLIGVDEQLRMLHLNGCLDTRDGARCRWDIYCSI